MKDCRFSSRAGRKLQFALEQFKVDVSGRICADLGAGTGGFTDCLLQNGARRVYAIDTGYGVLDWKLRNDSRVVVMERVNALHAELPELVDFVSIDVSWTPQRLIVPQAMQHLKDTGDIVSLLKPHYEAERSWLEDGTVIGCFLPVIVRKVLGELSAQEVEVQKVVESPLLGKKGGNTEYLLWIRKNLAPEGLSVT